MKRFGGAGGRCRTKVHVSAIFCDDTEVNAAQGGENLRLRLSGIDEEDVQSGFVVCDYRITVPVVSYFQAQLQVPPPPHPAPPRGAGVFIPHTLAVQCIWVANGFVLFSFCSKERKQVDLPLEVVL